MSTAFISSKAEHKAAPTSQLNRIEILDSHRGFSLLEIIIANSADFFLYVFQSSGGHKSDATAPMDGVLNFFIRVFGIDAKFFIRKSWTQ